jgi:hypothetical protein
VTIYVQQPMMAPAFVIRLTNPSETYDVRTVRGGTASVRRLSDAGRFRRFEDLVTDDYRRSPPRVRTRQLGAFGINDKAGCLQVSSSVLSTNGGLQSVESVGVDTFVHPLFESFLSRIFADDAPHPSATINTALYQCHPPGRQSGMRSRGAQQSFSLNALSRVCSVTNAEPVAVRGFA